MTLGSGQSTFEESRVGCPGVLCLLSLTPVASLPCHARCHSEVLIFFHLTEICNCFQVSQGYFWSHYSVQTFGMRIKMMRDGHCWPVGICISPFRTKIIIKSYHIVTRLGRRTAFSHIQCSFSPLTRLNCSMIFLHICYSLKCKASATEPRSSYPCVLGQSLAKCYPCNLGYFHSLFFFHLF